MTKDQIVMMELVRAYCRDEAIEELAAARSKKQLELTRAANVVMQIQAELDAIEEVLVENVTAAAEAIGRKTLDGGTR
jgi:hypothetical protein